jgi:hypothetical protein
MKVFTAVTMKNAVFWDIRTLIVPHRKHVRFEVFTAVTMKNGVFWDVTLCGSCKSRRFGRTWRLFIRVTRIGEIGTTQYQVISSQRT